MTSRCAHNILAFLRNNVKNGVDSIKEARRFAQEIEGLTKDERLFLEVALHDRRQLEAFYGIFCARTVEVAGP